MAEKILAMPKGPRFRATRRATACLVLSASIAIAGCSEKHIPAETICVKSHTERKLVYTVTMIPPVMQGGIGTRKAGWVPRDVTVCDERAVNPEWVEWKAQQSEGK